jgi:hypothetical protein
MQDAMVTKISAGLVLALAALGCGEQGSTVAQEVQETQIKLDLPPAPTFPELKPNSDGTHPVMEMRLRGAKYLNQSVKITGYVVQNYDLNTCADELGMKALEKDPSKCRADDMPCIHKLGQKLVDDDPTRCTKPYFYLADEPNASQDKVVWVVEVPRPLRADEMQDKALVDAFKIGPQPPTFKIGDKIVAEGEWKERSPMGFGRTGGILVYKSYTPAL